MNDLNFILFRSLIVGVFLAGALLLDVKYYKIDNKIIIVFALICAGLGIQDALISGKMDLQYVLIRMASAAAVFVACFISTSLNVMRFGGSDAKVLSLLALAYPLWQVGLIFGLGLLILFFVMWAAYEAPVRLPGLLDRVQNRMPYMLVLFWGYLAATACIIYISL